MKIACPYCPAIKVITIKTAESGQPIICPGCGKDMHRPDWKPPYKGGAQ